MDAVLKLLADASLEASQAEEAVEQTAWTSAGERIDAGRVALQQLRDAWPGLTPAHRAVVGPTAAQVRDRLDACARRVPQRRSLVEVPGRPDPEQDAPPD